MINKFKKEAFEVLKTFYTKADALSAEVALLRERVKTGDAHADQIQAKIKHADEQFKAAYEIAQQKIEILTLQYKAKSRAWHTLNPNLLDEKITALLNSPIKLTGEEYKQLQSLTTDYTTLRYINDHADQNNVLFNRVNLNAEDKTAGFELLEQLTNQLETVVKAGFSQWEKTNKDLQPLTHLMTPERFDKHFPTFDHPHYMQEDEMETEEEVTDSKVKKLKELILTGVPTTDNKESSSMATDNSAIDSETDNKESSSMATDYEKVDG